MFSVRRRVEFCDTDMAGIAHFSNFFRWMESAEHEYLRACGLSVFMTADGERLTFPRVSASCDYERPVRFEDVLDVEVAVTKVGRTSVQYGVLFRHDGRRVAEGRLTTVLCRVREGHALEAIEVPAALRERLLAGPPQNDDTRVAAC